MQHEVTSRPSRPRRPAAAGLVALDRPSGRSLLVEGLVVYLVLGLLTIPFLAAIRAAARRSSMMCCWGSGRRSMGWPGCCAWVPADLAGQPVRRRAVPGQPPAWGAVPGQPAVLGAGVDLDGAGGGGGGPPRPGRAGDVAVLPGRAGTGGGGGPGWVASGLSVEFAAHHLVEPVAGDRLDAAGVGPGASGPGIRPAPLCGPVWGRGRVAAAGRPS